MLILIIIGAIILLAVLIIALYNSLVSSRQRVQEAESDINVQLKRRYDLIPNLIETVKGYAAHEKTTLEEVTTARTTAMQATGIVAKTEAENQLEGTLKSLFAVAENYPGLKANQNFLDLQTELTDTEDKIQAARRFYNGSVRDYNIKLQQFPTSVIAGMTAFKPADYFEVKNQAEIAEPVKVEF